MSGSMRLKGDVELVALKRKMGMGAVVPVTAEQLIDRAPKQSKYRNEPVVIDGERFDSKGEAERYLELKMLERAGEITALRRQVAFGLTVNGQLIGTYVADFIYRSCLKLIVEDFKSPASKTPLYEWKRKHLLAEHGIEIFETRKAA